MSHVDSNIFSSVISDIDTEYGNISKMTITWGKIHRYSGMTMEYYLKGKIILYMVH